MLPLTFFNNPFSKLGEVAKSLELDWFAYDELLAIDCEATLYVAENSVAFAVLDEENVALFYTLRECATVEEAITDELFVLEVDELKILIFDAKTHVFLFVKERNAAEADELVYSLL